MTLPELLAARAVADPDGVAMVVDGVGELAYRDWDARANAVANRLIGEGITGGDRVGLVFPASGWIEYAVAFLGVLRAGAVAVPLSDRLPAAEIGQLSAHCSMAAVVRDAAGSDVTPPPVVVRASDPAQILYTSGTTGAAKGVTATHANLAYGLRAEPRYRAFRHSKHLVHAFPIGTNAGQMMLVNALGAHPAVVTLPRFTPGRFAGLIRKYRAGTVFVVPAMAIELINAGVEPLESVLLLGSAAAPLPSAVASELGGLFPQAMITNYYTSTEAAPAQTIMLFDPERPGSVGRPAAGGGVRVTAADGSPVGVGETGEVWMRSPAAPRAYFGDPGSGVFRDGWVRMGDLGYLDDEGYLYLVDRESDVVKSGAYKISTLKIEEALHAHPLVKEAAAFGVPHPVLGTVVVAALVVRDVVAPEEVRAFLGERLAGHEVPARLLTLEALPRNRGGKVDKRALRALS
ncbi:long-chain fatty acid--CoA ligase [Acrocarpospora macrocephala]|uniref:Long-chain-fatty-acid--CoA ligase n=1 Tax=Acrocarpospora macrocephala TaxID=150177 RepID=A0A5M3X4G7_9ACTN|nr:class I adenylate-forming enzyme family protein [Acrocarpospora macrocephala]GES16605.1 long-chain-fatty-acid--CoA ligase [Acrocarpospora macrocephala]